MKNITRHNGELEIIKRLPSSVNGNPRYLAMVGGFTFLTAVDSSYGYVLPNFKGRRVSVLIGTHYGKPTLHQITTKLR